MKLTEKTYKTQQRLLSQQVDAARRQHGEAALAAAEGRGEAGVADQHRAEINRLEAELENLEAAWIVAAPEREREQEEATARAESERRQAGYDRYREAVQEEARICGKIEKAAAKLGELCAARDEASQKRTGAAAMLRPHNLIESLLLEQIITSHEIQKLVTSVADKSFCGFRVHEDVSIAGRVQTRLANALALAARLFGVEGEVATPVARPARAVEHKPRPFVDQGVSVSDDDLRKMGYNVVPERSRAIPPIGVQRHS